jgi:glutamyl-Q tRNA(Asp) synthetase
LHKGSLLAAVASWLDARAHGGRWLVRIEDLDTPRVVPGAADAMLATLAAFGMESDEPVLYQSARREAYREALAKLADAGLAYRCTCSRGERAGPRCRCRSNRSPPGGDAAWRLMLDDEPILFEDCLQGAQRYLPTQLGDPVLFRKDGIAAYQLAVVVDDAFQGITHVVRGADLLDSTAWQVVIGRALALPQPRWTHVPVLTEPGGAKLAKSRRSLPLEGLDTAATLAEILGLLGISLPAELKAAPISDMLQWSVQHWRLEKIRGVREIALADRASLEKTYAPSDQGRR